MKRMLAGIAASVMGIALAETLYFNCRTECDPWSQTSTAAWIQAQINAGIIPGNTTNTINVTNDLQRGIYYTYQYLPPSNYSIYHGWTQTGYTSLPGGGGGGGGGPGGGLYPPGFFCLDDGSNCDYNDV